MPKSRRQARRRPVKTEGGILWNILASISFIASILLFVGLALHTWRVNDRISFTYMVGSSAVTDSFASSSYGLYMMSFNGGAVVKNWNTLQTQICTGIDSLAPISGGLEIIGQGSCGTTCIAHFRNRCNVYTRLQFWGFLTLGFLIVTASLGIFASAWVFLFGVHRVILQLLWTCTSVLALAVIGFWVMQSDNLFKALTADSQFPYPSLSTAAYLSMVGCGLLLLCGVISLLIGYCTDRAEWAAKQQEIDNKIINQGAGEPFGPGLMMGQIGAGFRGAPFGMPPGGGINKPPPPALPPGMMGKGPPGSQWGPPGLQGGPQLPPRAMQMPGMPPPAPTPHPGARRY